MNKNKGYMEEKWRDIKGYKRYYQVSNLGKVRSLDRTVPIKKGSKRVKGRILTQVPDKDGYLYLGLKKYGIRKAFKVHRLVAQAFKRNPKNKPQVNHKNCIKTDNRACNLEWNTSLENITHAIKSGVTKQRGEDHRNAKLTNKQVLEIGELLLEGCKTQRQIGEIYGVSNVVIGNIKTGKGWSHVTGKSKRGKP